MIFKIDYTGSLEDRVLIYRDNECSFDMSPWSHVIDFELALNKLTLSVVDDKVIQLSGFCCLTKKMYCEATVPDYQKGELKIEHNLEYGFIYNINNNIDFEYPVCVNVRTGWVCIGEPDNLGKAVEFIRNCVAVIDRNGSLLSLWLKPEALPEF